MSQPRKDNGGKAWQVLLGSGGSPFEAPACDATVNPQTDRDYAWTMRRILEITIYGFNA